MIVHNNYWRAGEHVYGESNQIQQQSLSGFEPRMLQLTWHESQTQIPLTIRVLPQGSFKTEQKYCSDKPNVSSHVPSSSAEGSPHSSGFLTEKPAASAAESEEVVAASMEPKPTPKEDFKARRLEAIQAKALEIEKHYRQDCETFRTVVKMLVAKEPNLDNLLQAPLDENLSEIKQRCLDALRHFVKELDEVLEQPDTSEQAKGEKPVK